MTIHQPVRFVDKRKANRYLLVMLVLLTGCGTPMDIFRASPLAASTPLAGALPDDFAFSLRYGSCDHNQISTFEQSFTKDMLDGSSITVDLTLADADLATIYTKMIEIGFFDYSEQFAVEIGSAQEVTSVTPASMYSFVVQRNGAKKSVNWYDAIIKPTSEKADQLRALIRLIQEIVNKQPAVQKLPPANGGCI